MNEGKFNDQLSHSIFRLDKNQIEYCML